MAFVQERNRRRLGLFHVGATALVVGVIATFVIQVWWGHSPLSRAAMLVTFLGAAIVLMSVGGRDDGYLLESYLDQLPADYELIPMPGHLAVSGQPVLVDCLLIGPNGVFAIDTVQLLGTVHVTEGYWTTGRRGKRRQLLSPAVRLQSAVEMLKAWLPSAEIPIHAAICILDERAEIDGRDILPVISLGQLLDFIVSQPGVWPDDVNVRKVIKRLSA